MKTLVLCRHAKSDWPDHVEDFRRPLAPRGLKDAERLGKLLKSHEFLPDLILSSPANRALHTARILREQLGVSKEIVQEQKLYDEGAGTLSAIVQALPAEAQTVMIFGHNPTMEQAVRLLLNMGNPYQMPTGGMVCLETNANDWQYAITQGFSLRWALCPRLQRKVEL